MSRLSVWLIALAVTALPARSAEGQEPTPADRALEVGASIADALSSEASHFYAIDLAAKQFVRGNAHQASVDVVLTVHGPDGAVVARFDGPARGLERFAFDADEAGQYRIEVASDNEESGRYELVLDVVEPVATVPVKRVDQLVAAYDDLDSPGGVVAVINGGELVFSRGFGAANLAHGIPFTADTRTNIGSTSKQFTAYAIGLLAQRGQLSLDDDVRKHLPDLKDFGTPVTLRHLLTHTSGYREFLNLLAIGGRRLDYDFVDRQELTEIVQRQPELQNEPGGEWNYNNTGFGLLAEVVAGVGGKPFPEWMRENVFLPLDMEHTAVRSDPRAIIPYSALGYADGDAETFQEAGDLAGAMGAGGIYTTVGDLAKWMGNLSRPTPEGAEIVNWMTTPYVLMNGDTTNYGLGLFLDEFKGLRRIHHGGADIAHRSTFVFFPELDAGFVALSNYANIPGSIPGGIPDAFFGEHLEEEGEAVADGAGFRPEDFDPESFDAFSGSYALDAAPSFVLKFRRDEARYYTEATGQPEIEIIPTSDSTFKLTVVEASVTFHREPDGTVKTVTLHQNGDNTATRVEDEALTSEQMAAYAGRYFSDEVETYYHVVVEEGQLILRHRRLDDVTLSRTGEDTFGGGFPVASVKFERDDGGGVIGFLAGNGRTRDVRFERVGVVVH